MRGVSLSTTSCVVVQVQGVYLSTTSSMNVQGITSHRQQCESAGCASTLPAVWTCRVFLVPPSYSFYAGTPDRPASDHSGTGMDKNTDAETSPVTEIMDPSSETEILRYRTVLLNAGMSTPVARPRSSLCPLVNSALPFIRGVHIGARALLDINLI